MLPDKRLSRAHISALVDDYFKRFMQRPEFVPGESYIPPSGKIFDENEMVFGVDAVLDGWWTEGKWTALFEGQLSHYIGTRFGLFCNSGSSANLLAVSSLRSKWLGDDSVEPGAEIITAAAGFPTTINPILQNGFRPVFVDVDLGTYVPNLEHFLKAWSPRTRGVMMAHTLGNPWRVDLVRQFASLGDRKVWLIEDNCDALGSLISKEKTGSVGDLATQSFYPAHHITTGEGGMVLTSNGRLKRAVESLRDWGRDCWCGPGAENTCRKRFDWNFPGMPEGYDHKYVYSEIGYNLKATDMQAAIGFAQIRKIPKFVALRRRNFYYVDSFLRAIPRFEEYFVLPRATNVSEPSWFGYPLTVRPSAPFALRDLELFLNERKIGTRRIFAGNYLRQPAMAWVQEYEVSGTLENTDAVMNGGFWFGVWPGVTIPMLDYIVEAFHDFVYRH